MENPHRRILFEYEGEKEGASLIISNAVAGWTKKGYQLSVYTEYIDSMDVYKAKITEK